MKYIPLRVYSVFSRGNGAVSPSGLASLMRKGGGVMAVTDPFSFLGWEKFHRAAKDNGLKFLPGMEISVRGFGSLLLFPRTPEGYFSIVSSYNKKRLTAMNEVSAVLVPGTIRGDISGAFNNIRKRIPGGDIYFGLEWNSDRRHLDYAEKERIPVVWANPLRWTGSPDSYKVVSSVFRHLPSAEADSDPLIPKGVWGFNGTERPGAVYLAAALAGYSQKGLPTFGIYGRDVQDKDDTSIPEDVQHKLLSFARAGLAVAEMRGKSYYPWVLFLWVLQGRLSMIISFPIFSE